MFAKCSAPAATEGQQQLPDDLLLEVAARVDDPATVVCFAASSRTLRRGILEASFRRRRLAFLGGRSGGGFDPTLLLGFSCRLFNGSAHVVRTATSPRPRLRIHESFYESFLDAFQTVASRDGLVVLRFEASSQRFYLAAAYGLATAVNLHVVDALTGRVTALPSLGSSEWYYPLALLHVAGGEGHRSFEALVADSSMRFKIFSSKNGHGQWGASRAVPDTPPFSTYPINAHPAVIGRTVYWLCGEVTVQGLNAVVHALDSDAGVATKVELPPGFRSATRFEESTLLAPVGGRLSLLLADLSGISMWTLASVSSAGPPSWSRQVVVSMRELTTRAALPFETGTRVRLQVFGERSGAVILFCADKLVRLDLGTKEVTRLHTSKDDPNERHISRIYLHEINFTSFLESMKPF